MLITTHEVREIEHILTDVTLIHRGRACLNAAMADLPSMYLKVTTSLKAAPEIKELKPLTERQTLKGHEYILAGADRSVLEKYGDVTTPNLAELFVAIIGEQQ